MTALARESAGRFDNPQAHTDYLNKILSTLVVSEGEEGEGLARFLNADGPPRPLSTARAEIVVSPDDEAGTQVRLRVVPRRRLDVAPSSISIVVETTATQQL